MFQFHGWAVLSPGPTGSEATGSEVIEELRVLAALEDEIADAVRRRIESAADDLRCAGVAKGNMITTVYFHGQYNHPRGGPLNFLRFIGEQAPGAYGVLFLRDDDDDPAHLNEYRVWRLARGQVTEFTDPFLSPCFPTIEDADKRFTPPDDL